MKNNAETLLSVCDALMSMKESNLDIGAVLQQLTVVRDVLAGVLNDGHPDDDQETTAKLRAGYEHIVASINELESAKGK
jgi:hypothetical protein